MAKSKNVTQTKVNVTKTSETGDELTVDVRKISNGYIVCQSLYKRGDGKKESKWLRKETYYENNPLEELVEESGGSGVFDFSNDNLKDFQSY